LVDTLAGKGQYFEQRNKQVNGNFSMSYNLIATTFEEYGNSEDKYWSKSFENLRDYRIIVAHRVAADRQRKIFYLDPETGLTDVYQLPADNEYPDGYSSTSQEVVIPSFLAAYTGQSPEKITLATFPKPWEMLPNWRVSYTGLKKFEFLKPYFKDIRLNHVYRATYNINSYTTNLRYEDGPSDSPQEGFDALQWMRYEVDTVNHFIPKYEVGNVSLSERFFPFFGVDVTMHNNITAKFEYSRDRTLSLSMANNQITEQWGREWTVGLGYRIPDVPLRIKVRGTTRDFNSDINIRADFSIRNNLTIIRRIEENMNQLTSGMKVYMIKTTADYMLTKNFVFKVFYDWTKNLPQVTYSPPTTNASFGFSLLFRLN
jgi:cell surface protein SprA